MRIGLAIAMLALCGASAGADPVNFHPDGCDFDVRFPSAPVTTETKTETDRGDSVTIERATLNDSGNYLRAECTHVPAMHFLDEDILKNAMNDMGSSYKLGGLSTRVDHNDAAGPVGWLHGQGKLGGKTVTIEIRRFTGKASILDVWIAADPDAFPTAVGTAFTQSVRLNGQEAK
jgi:hypothetical protein